MTLLHYLPAPEIPSTVRKQRHLERKMTLLWIRLSHTENVWFLPRDAMRKRGLCCRAVARCPSDRLSVCPSVMFVYCVQTASDIVKLLPRPGSPIVLFDPERRYPIPRGTPSAGLLNTRGWKNLRFSTEIAVAYFICSHNVRRTLPPVF